MRYRFFPLICLLIVFAFTYCQKRAVIRTTQLKIGKGAQSINKIYINKQSVRDIMLLGGNKNYSVQVEKSDIASVKIYDDTLRIKGLLEGVTFATVVSADEEKKLEIYVTSQNIFFSQDTLYLYPGYGVEDQNTRIQLTGGGETPLIKVKDTDHIISVRWDARSNYLNIRSYKEGEAYITATSQDGTQSRRLTVIVRAEDADSVYKTRGLYKTTHRTTLNNILMTVSCIKTPMNNQGAQNTNHCDCNSTQSTATTSSTTNTNTKFSWLIVSKQTQWGLISTDNNSNNVCVKIQATNITTLPVVGSHIPIKVETTQGSAPIGNRTYNMLVEHISGDSLITLRGSDFKFVLPISKDLNKKKK